MEEGKQIKRSRDLTFWGFAISVAYVVSMATYSIVEWDDLLRLKGSEFGDLLAGVFSPLAFLWLVLGFFQQGQELRASVQALELQGRELQHSVEQQRQLVEVTREQLEFQAQALTAKQHEIDRVSQPKLEMSPSFNSGGSKPDHREYNFRLANYGKPATDVQVVDVVARKLVRRTPLLETGKEVDFKFEFPIQGKEQKFMRVGYVDARGLQRSKSFIISIDDGRVACQPEEDD